MLNFLLRRIARIVSLLIIVELLVFLLIHLIPGSPWDTPDNQLKALRNVFVSTTTLTARNRYFGLDLPIWRQFTRYLIGDIQTDGQLTCGVICGNLGPSTRQAGRSVQEILFDPPNGRSRWYSRFGYTSRLIAYSFTIVTVLGIPLGIASAYRAKSYFDQIVSMVFTTAASIPIFVHGLLGIIIFASRLKWIKVIPDWTKPEYWILPTILLAIVPLTSLVRLTRAVMLNEMSSEYVRTARAKGRTRIQAVWLHVLPNTLLSITTFLFPVFVELVASSFIIEGIFGFPGFGREYWDSIGDLDYAMIMGITFIYACGITLVNLILETILYFLDPRIQKTD